VCEKFRGSGGSWGKETFEVRSQRRKSHYSRGREKGRARSHPRRGGRVEESGRSSTRRKNRKIVREAWELRCGLREGNAFACRGVQTAKEGGLVGRGVQTTEK